MPARAKRKPLTPEQEQRRQRRHEIVREHRDRQRRGLAIYMCACDSEVLSMLVRKNYISDSEIVDNRLVNRALSLLLHDISRA